MKFADPDPEERELSIRKSILRSTALIGVLLAVPAAVQAQAAPEITVGAEVKDPQGGLVGTVTAFQNGNAVVKTDKHEVALPASSFAKAESGYLIGMTQAQLNEAVEQATAKSQELVAVGATVRGPAGQTVGTIQELDDQFATLQLAGEETKVRLPRSAIGASAEGPVIGLTAEELKAQVAGGSASATN